MALNIKVSSSDWIDLRARGFVSGMYLVNQVGAPIEYSTAATPAAGSAVQGSSAVQVNGTYLWVRGFGDCELYTTAEWSAANAKTVPLTATLSSGGLGNLDGGGLLVSPGLGVIASSPGYLPINTISRATIATAYEQVVASRLGDGYVYRISGTTLSRTSDGLAWLPVCTAPSTSRLILNAGDGEVLIAAGSSGVHRSTGWGKPSCTFTQVLDSLGADVLSWGMDTNGRGLCVATHYWGSPYNKSRYAWKSTDSGKTWVVIHDINGMHGSDPNANEWHRHFIAIDPWANDRILIGYHGNPAMSQIGKSLEYSDDGGVTWTVLSDQWQPTTCVPTRGGLVMGTDDGPGGILIARRNASGGYDAPYLAARLPTEQTKSAWNFAIYAQRDDFDGTVYTTFISQVTTPLTPAAIMASDGISAALIYKSVPMRNTEGYREFGILPSGALMIYAQESDGVAAAVSSYFRSPRPLRGAVDPQWFDDGRVLGGRTIGANPFRGTAGGIRAVAGPGAGASSFGANSRAGSNGEDAPSASAFGENTEAKHAGSAIFGANGSALFGSAVFGEGCVSTKFDVCFGRRSKSTVGWGTAVGFEAEATKGYGVAVGYQCKVNHDNAMAFGKQTTTKRNDAANFGAVDLELEKSGAGLITRSPDGTLYRVTVANGGTLSVTAV